MILYWLSLNAYAATNQQEELPPEQPKNNSPISGVAISKNEEKKLHTGNALLDAGSFEGGIYSLTRYRDRLHIEPGQDKKDAHKITNLNHSSLQAALGFNSGLFQDIIGFDLGIYGSADIYNNGSPEHEMNFVPRSTPWRSSDKKDAQDSASIYKANLKLQAGRAWIKAGYFQPTGPGVLGVNWAALPGAYQGLEAGAGIGKFDFAAAVVNAYKAPWYREFYGFRQNDGKTRVDYFWSTGLRWRASKMLSLELAAGAAENYLRNAHFKFDYALPLNTGKLNFKYHLYLMDDDDNSGSVNDNFDGIASQHYAALFWKSESFWSAKFEFTYTRAPQSNPNHAGYFAYRLTSIYAGSRGAYDVDWNARSDWNHDREAAFFIALDFDLQELLPGLGSGIGYAYGCNGKAYGYSERLSESAWTADLRYRFGAEGWLKNSTINLHFTRYYNHTRLASWNGFKNAFQNESDIKLFISIPF